MKPNSVFLVVALLFLCSMAVPAHAASSAVSATTNTDLYFGGVDVLASNAGITVTYSAMVYDNSTNAVIGPNSTVAANEVLKFVFTPHVYTDVSWYGTGYGFDTPYGHWVANAASPGGMGCVASDYLQTNYAYPESEDEYIALDVDPPAETLTGTTGLSCQPPTTDAANNVTEICTVTGTGNLTPTFNFAATNGIFYYSNARYINNVYNGCIGGTGGGTALITNNMGTGVTYVASIPVTTISYPLTGPVPTNQPPATPALSCPAGGQTGQALSFTLQGTDPNGDPIRYGMDWTNSNSVNEWVPSSGYVPSGTSQTVSHSWATAGTYTIKALSQDSSSANSGWSTSCSVTITNPPAPTALLTASPSSVAYGSAATLQWSSTNATSCTGTGFSTGGATSGSVSTGALTSNQTYSVSCTGAGGTASNSATVAVLPPPPASISATCNANGTAVTLSWPAAPGATSYNPRVNGNPIQPQCGQAGWQVWTDGTTCYPNPDVWGPTTVNNFPVNPGQTYSANVFSANANGTNWNSAPSTNFTCMGKADLIAGSVTPTSATAGVPVTLSATASNTGNATSGSFPVLFQVQSPADLRDSSYLAALAPGASAPASISYTFPAAGTYQVRACANYDTNWVAITPESNYSNNCGAWTTVNVVPPPPASISATCNANGTAVTLSWPAAPGATSYNPRVGSNPIQPQCGQAGWQVWTDGTTCYPNPDVWGPTTVNNFPVNPGQAYTAWVHSANANGVNWNQAASTNFTCSGQADLTAGNTSLSASPISGTPVTFTATAQNTGNSPSGSFPVLFQVQDSLGNNVSLTDSSYLPGLAPAASAPASISYTFTSVGTYQIRACANYNTSWVAITPESNYSNNCGAWTSVTVAAPPPTGALSCTVNNQNPTPGTTIIYTVTPSNGATGPYTWNDTQGGSYGTGSTASRLISSLGSYTMFVSGQNVVSQPVSCPIVTGGCASAAGSIAATPNRVRSGDTTTLSWSASGINTSCVVSGPGVAQTTSANACSVSPSSITTPAITRQSVYTLTCDGSQIGQVIVNVVPNFTEF